MALTQGDIAQTHAALTAAEGDRSVAADALGITKTELTTRIHTYPALKELWANNTVKEGAPSVADTLARTSPVPSEALEGPVLHNHELALAMAITAEDNKFRGGLGGLGLSASDMDLAVSLQSFHGKHFAKCVDLITAGLTITALRVIREIERTLARINQGFEGENALSEERMYLTHFNKLCENLTVMTNAAANGAAIRAKIDLWKKQAAEAAAKPQKPVFGSPPLQAVIHTDTVNIKS